MCRNKFTCFIPCSKVSRSTSCATLCCQQPQPSWGDFPLTQGKMVTWDEIMVDPNKNPALYNWRMRPTPEDFEQGTVEMPQEGVVPIPGLPAK